MKSLMKNQKHIFYSLSLKSSFKKNVALLSVSFVGAVLVVMIWGYNKLVYVGQPPVGHEVLLNPELFLQHGRKSGTN